MAETYIPLLKAWTRLLEDGIRTPTTLSLSPLLMEQLASAYLKEGFIEYLKVQESQATADERDFQARSQKELARLAADYIRFYQDIRRSFVVDFNRDLIGVIREISQKMPLEILATAATHSYLPLIKDRASLERQITVGRDCFKKHLGYDPRGFWLPECGYYPGLEEILARNGIRYFFVDGHAIEGGKPAQVFSGYEPVVDAEAEGFRKTGLSTYSPYRVKGSSMGVLGRNTMVSLQVWSKDYGYPGDGGYREFHKQKPGSGLKYWRVTDRKSDLISKLVYDPQLAQDTVKRHAFHFVDVIEKISWEAEALGYSDPVIVGCYDTELFGHWWWEGVDWLEAVSRLIADRDHWQMVTPEMVMKNLNSLPEAQVFESSWGVGGKHYGWLNPETSWMWDTIDKARLEVKGLLEAPSGGELGLRAKAQAVKELMLMESSDWFFMVTHNSTRDYAIRRFLDHYGRLVRLTDMAKRNQFGAEAVEWLQRVEKEDDIF